MALSGGGLDYINMQFPIVRGLGASIGLLPYSSVGYAFGNDINNGYASRSGSGSINQLYAGLGYSPFRGFSIGANFAYLFGTTYNDSYAITSGGSTTLFERQLEVRDWNVNIGIQWVLPRAATPLSSVSSLHRQVMSSPMSKRKVMESMRA